MASDRDTTGLTGMREPAMATRRQPHASRRTAPGAQLLFGGLPGSIIVPVCLYLSNLKYVRRY